MQIELINLEQEYGNLQEVSEPTIVFRNKFHDKGLFSEQIFGPVEDYKCQCGRYSGREYANKVCENCRVTITKSNIRLTTFAKISIPEFCCIVNPIVLSMFLKYYLPSKYNKINIEKIVQGKEWIIIEGEEIKIVNKKNDKAQTGPVFFREELYPFLLKQDDLIKAFDKQYYNLLFINTIPVIPPDVRPLCMAECGRAVYQEDINESYIKILRTLKSTRKAPFVFDTIHVVLQRQYELLIKTLMTKYEKKQGFLRAHVLGKRIDYSGRAVIVVDGGNMPLGWCKIPFKIAKEIYKPQVIPLVSEKLQISPLKILEDYDTPNLKNHILTILKSNFIGTYIILNRQPTLHRPGIQSMKIYDIILEDVIVVHPLVCSSYNADFDGDQMAVYLPQTLALEDARTKMWVDNNYRKPSNGEILFNFSQDMILGLHLITADISKPTTYLEQETFENRVSLFQKVVDEKYHNNIELFQLFNTVFDKKKVSNIIEQLEIILSKTEWLHSMDMLCRLGFYSSSDATISLQDFIFDDCFRDDLQNVPDNNVTKVIRSGARGSFDNLRQISFEKGFISDVTGRVLPTPIESSLLQGLSTKEYFTSCYGGRKGLVDTADNTAKSGYLTRKLMYLLLNTTLDCEYSSCHVEKENNHVFNFTVRDDGTAKSLIGRYTVDGKIDKINYKNIIGKTIGLYSPITCSCKDGICQHCYGDLYNIHHSKMIGIIAAQSLGEKATQLTLRTKHTSGSTESIFKNLKNKLELQEGIITAKESGYFYFEDEHIIFVFEEDEFVFSGYDTFELFDSLECVMFEDKETYEFEAGQEIATITIASRDVVSAVTELSTLLSRPDENVSIEDYLYQLISIYGSFASLDLIHFELILSILTRDLSDLSKPHRWNPDAAYKIIGLQKLIELIPEQALAFERFSKNIMNYIPNGFNKAQESKISFLKSLLFFEFDERKVPEKVWG